MTRTDAIASLSDLLGGHHDVAVRLADALRIEHNTWEEVIKAALIMDDGAFLDLASALARDVGPLNVSGARCIDLTVRDHMTPTRHSEGYKIVIAIQNCWDKNNNLSRALPDINDRIDANITAVMERFDLTLGEWHLWCKEARPHRTPRAAGAR